MPKVRDVTFEFTIWCSRCGNWHQDGYSPKLGVKENLKYLLGLCGWSKIDGRVVCTKCVEKGMVGT